MYLYGTGGGGKLKSWDGYRLEGGYSGFSHHKCTVDIVCFIFKAQVATLAITLGTCVTEVMQL